MNKHFSHVILCVTALCMTSNQNFTGNESSRPRDRNELDYSEEMFKRNSCQKSENERIKKLYELKENTYHSLSSKNTAELLLMSYMLQESIAHQQNTYAQRTIDWLEQALNAINSRLAEIEKKLDR